MEMNLEAKVAIQAYEIRRLRSTICKLREAAGQASEATLAFDAENEELFAFVNKNHEMRS